MLTTVACLLYAQERYTVKILLIGAGVTGCFTATCLGHKGVDIAVLARGSKAVRLERDGLRMRDGITGETTTVPLKIVRSPVPDKFDAAMVCVQAHDQRSCIPLLSELPGRPIVWFLGNNTVGYDSAIEQLGRDRVLGGFPGVGGTWEGDVLVYADRLKLDDKPFNRLILGEAHPDAAEAADAIQRYLQTVTMHIERYAPIMAWHWSHIATILPLAGALYHSGQNLGSMVDDRALLKSAVRATAQGLAIIRKAGYPILPRSLNIFRWIPAALMARKVASLLQSDFGRIALAGHATTARDEMRSLALSLLNLAGDNPGADLRNLLSVI